MTARSLTLTVTTLALLSVGAAKARADFDIDIDVGYGRHCRPAVVYAPPVYYSAPRVVYYDHCAPVYRSYYSPRVIYRSSPVRYYHRPAYVGRRVIYRY